ncbi:MAG: hypothetical protein LV479_01995 [Methylacidiphilales bacterium]|nr:hypothetical protein [Candidatus Methylacidiphilales bacterium]
MTGTEIYKRTPAYESDAPSIRLHAPQWKFLLTFDGQRSLSEVALSSDTTFADAIPLTEKFLSQGWIEEQPITLDQYLKRTGTPTLASGAVVPPVVVLHEPRPEGSSPSPAPPTLPITPAQPAPSSTSGIPSPSPKVSRGPMRLSSVVDYITSLSGNTSLGHLLVYRVFLRVPPELLQAEDIASVHLLNDNSLIRSEALQEAIAKAVNEVAKRPLPDGVYAPA